MSEPGAGEGDQGPKPNTEPTFVDKSDALATKLGKNIYYNNRFAEGYPHADQPVATVVSAETAELYRDVAPIGVTIDTIASPGESFTTSGGHSVTVPEGKKYISIDKGEHKDLSQFWDAVRAEQARRDAVAKPPKQ